MISPYAFPGIRLPEVGSYEDQLFKALNEMGYTRQYLAQRVRNKPLVYHKQVFAYLLRHNSLLSLSAIGKKVGWTNHTTVLHALNMVQDALDGYNDTLLQIHNQVKTIIDENSKIY